jgi:protocatechuate 3,4-dioxygenase beta subunit
MADNLRELDEPHDHDRGLAFDLSTLIQRRRALKLIAGTGLVALVGCLSDDDAASTASTSSTTTAATSGSGSGSTGGSEGSDTTTASDGDVSAIPEETAGPYPGDGSNGPNVLTESGIVRRGIRPSFGSASGVAEGVPLTVNLTVVDASGGSSPLAGAAVYAWHCTRDGEYSLYSQSIADENYLRGVQETDADGALSFTSIFPGCYSGRWPHIHFEVYATLADATGGGSPIATSQLALPEDACATVYATDGYSQSVQNLARTSLESDMVFSDGYAQQLAATTGSVDAGYVAELSVGV